MAAADAEAASRLFVDVYQPRLRRLGVRRLRDLAQLARYKFLESLVEEPLRPARRPRRPLPLKSRYHTELKAQPEAEEALGKYWEALQAVLADLEITEQEQQYLLRRAQELRLHPEQIRMLHARVFASAIQTMIDDSWLDDEECARLRRMYQCLAELGWAPGQ